MLYSWLLNHPRAAMRGLQQAGHENGAFKFVVACLIDQSLGERSSWLRGSLTAEKGSDSLLGIG